ncbi:uncharacterized protein LOC142903487 isoform X2 [Nelusetta ayraudi]|uniref:uncharacterized protein LOC142903487 isoform X2 n=1 Tax=Nelusetta ayraudi TaxID=303726 RepID=UPI003F707996
MLLTHHHHPSPSLVPLSWSQPPSSSSSSSTPSSTSPSTSSTPPKAPVPLVPKMVPTFSTAATFKQRQQVRGGGGGGGGKLVGRRVTIPLHRKQGPSSSTSSSPARPPPFVPIFGRHPKPLAAAVSPTVKPLPRPSSGPPASIDPPLTPKLNFRPCKLPRPSARCGGPVEEQQASVGAPPLNARHRPASRGVRSTPAHLDVELRVRISQEEPSQKVVVGTEGQMEDEEAQLEV